jgi:ribA/ribD-fused uncharacterized protein
VAIKFYAPGDQNGFLSNFYESQIFLRGKSWPTSEHFYQAMKFAGTDNEDLIRKAQTPGQAWKLARKLTRKIRAGWHNIKDDIMREAVLGKFAQNSELRQMLLDTGNQELIERSKDGYWGDGDDGSGKNMLGKILMETREKIRSGF